MSENKVSSPRSDLFPETVPLAFKLKIIHRFNVYFRQISNRLNVLFVVKSPAGFYQHVVDTDHAPTCLTEITYFPPGLLNKAADTLATSNTEPGRL